MVPRLNLKSMNEIEKKVLEVLHNLNWLIEGHNSFAELIKVKGNKVVIRCVGYCAECESNCIEVAFKERMPDIELIIRRNSAALKKKIKN